MSDSQRKSSSISILDRQLRKFSLQRDCLPTDLEAWAAFLNRIENTYTGFDEDRYTLTRSLELSSKEMEELYARLQESSKQQLSRERDKFEAVISAIGEGVVMLHDSGNVLFVNPDACELIGASKEKIKGHNFFDWITVNELSSEVVSQKILSKELKSFEAELAYGEKTLPVLVTASIFHDKMSGVNAIVLVFRDITLQREAKKLIEEQRDRAEEHSAHKSDFLASMSHEIRTPLNAIVSLVDLVLDSPLNEEQETDLHTIKNCADSLKSLINNVLDLSKIEAGKVYLDSVSADVYAVAQKTIGQLRAIASGKHIQIQCSVSSEVPSTILIDAFRLEQILTNLLSNAIKFSPEQGTITLSVGTVSDETNEMLIQFSVTDEGAGIAPERLDKIFEAFTQENNSTVRQFGGTGLGLTISAHLVKLMGGTIWVNSELGEGSTFAFTVKPEQVLKSTDSAVIKRESLQRSAQSANEHMRILLVDDNEINQNTISRMLKTKGFDVSLAENGQVAVDLVDRTNFDIVLMDLNMPVMGGLEAIQKIRDLPGQNHAIPIIVLTADVLVGTEKKCLEVGANGYVSKPIDYDLLVSNIQRFVETKFEGES